MTGGAGQSNRVLAVFEFVERLSRAVLVHRLDLPVTGDAAFEL